jgi:hypothetical protein
VSGALTPGTPLTWLDYSRIRPWKRTVRCYVSTVYDTWITAHSSNGILMLERHDEGILWILGTHGWNSPEVRAARAARQIRDSSAGIASHRDQDELTWLERQ